MQVFGGRVSPRRAKNEAETLKQECVWPAGPVKRPIQLEQSENKVGGCGQKGN